jgi:hypothetical protein
MHATLVRWQLEVATAITSITKNCGTSWLVVTFLTVCGDFMVTLLTACVLFFFLNNGIKLYACMLH